MHVLTVKKLVEKDFSTMFDKKDHPGTPIMHVGKFARGLGWFYPAEYVPSAELPDEEYPIILMTGRILYHYTTRAMTGKLRN